jgi:hypothetical protein
VAQAGERFPLPPAPALAQAQAGEPGHEVELRGPGVATLDRVRVDPAVVENEVIGGQALRDHVIDVERHGGAVSV